MKWYFGFGANRDKVMLTAICGSRPLFGLFAQLVDYSLCIDHLHDLPRPAQSILQIPWGKSFYSYTIAHHRHDVVTGTLWLLTNKQRKAISLWELDHVWSRNRLVKVQAMFGPIPITVHAYTESVTTDSLRHRVDGQRYKTYLLSKEKMWQVAERVRLGVLTG